MGNSKEVNRRYYLKNKEKFRERCRARREELKQYIWDYKCAHPCVDCGERDPVVLEYDHVPERGEKEFSVAQAPTKGVSLERLKKEIAKCDIRCANCHVRVTWARRQQS